MEGKEGKEKLTASEVIDEAHDLVPIPAEKKSRHGVYPAFQELDGTFKKGERPDIEPAKQPTTHPLAVGLREAKAAINEILKDPKNLELLLITLDGEFKQDPPGFLLRYEPLLRRFEGSSLGEEQESVGVRLFVRGGDTAVEISRRKKQ